MNPTIMLTTTLALLVLLGSALLVISHLRVVVQDTYTAVVTCAMRARAGGRLVPRMAFVALWVLIFALSFMG